MVPPLSICWTGPLWDGFGREGLSGTLLYASGKRYVKQFITIVQSPGITLLSGNRRCHAASGLS